MFDTDSRLTPPSSTGLRALNGNTVCAGRAAVSSAAADAPVMITVVPSAIGRKASN